MEYAFLNTRLKERRNYLPIEQLKSLSSGASRNQVLIVLEKLGLSLNMQLNEANYKINQHFLSEMRKISSILRGSPFLRLLARRFEIEEIMDFFTTFNSSKLSGKPVLLTAPEGFESSRSLIDVVNTLNHRFGFNLNQNLTPGSLRDALLTAYLSKLVRISSGDSKNVIYRERRLINAIYSEDFGYENGRFSRILAGEKNLIDLRIDFYLYDLSSKLAIKNPLGDMVLINYVYQLSLSCKLLKSLFFSLKKGIRLDYGGIWEI